MAKRKAATEGQGSGDAIAETIRLIREKFGKDAALCPEYEDARSEVRRVIPTGVDVIDRYIIGIGGLPSGRLVEVFSAEGGGKTTLTWKTLATTTAAGGVASYCDNEQSFDSRRAGILGVDLSKILLLQPWILEEALEEMLFTVKLPIYQTPDVAKLMAWDSVAGAQFKADLDGMFTKEAADDRAKKLGKFCRAIAPELARRQITLLIMNQERPKRGVSFGLNVVTPGGKAIPFASSVRLWMVGGKAVRDGLNQHVGKTVTVICIKNRHAPPWRKAKVRLDYASGWDNLWSTCNLAKDLKLIEKKARATPDTYVRAVAALGRMFPEGKWDQATPVEQLKVGAATEADEVEDGEEVLNWTELPADDPDKPTVDPLDFSGEAK